MIQKDSGNAGNGPSRWCFLLAHLPALATGVVPNIPFVQKGIVLRVLDLENKRMCFEDFLAVTLSLEIIYPCPSTDFFHFSSGAAINRVHTGV